MSAVQSRWLARLLPILLVATLIAACEKKSLFEPHRVETQPEAGSVNLSVTLIAPWEDYIAALSPDFELTAGEALEKVLPRTTVLEEKFLDSIAFSTQVGLPQNGEPGEVPGAPAAPSGAERGAASLPGVPNSQRSVSKDPMLEFTAATALYQEVQLLNRYVTDAALKSGSQAYVVRLQLSVVPHARHQPYDVYTTMGFLQKQARPASCRCWSLTT